MSQFNMLFLGDSVVWGQGLTEETKFSTKLANWVDQWHAPAITASRTVFAHSGAVIGAGKPSGGLFRHGEVPTELPSILDQVTRYAGDPQDIDLVVLNGGINDVGTQYIASPLTDANDLATEIDRHCRQHMSGLIVAAAQRFSKPSTRILVTGYYPVLSPHSDPFGITLLLALLGVALPPFPAIAGLQLPLQKVIANFMLFWQASDAALQQAVVEANALLGVPQKAVFVSPGIQAVNAAFAPSPWIFGVNANLSAQDAISGARHVVCNAQEPDLIQRQLCYRASAGHPNVWGADAYFRALFPLLQTLYGL